MAAEVPYPNIEELRQKLCLEPFASSTGPSVRSLILSLAPDIDRKIRDGARTKDICDWLASQNINIKYPTLRTYLSQWRQYHQSTPAPVPAATQRPRVPPRSPETDPSSASTSRPIGNFVPSTPIDQL